MVSFRKLVLVLAVVALFASVASAQITCQVASDQPAIRAEGFAELVGQVRLVCTTPAAATPTGLTGNFRIQSTGPNITTRLSSTDTPAPTTVRLTVETAGGTVVSTQTGTQTNDKTVDFLNVPMAYAPNGTGLVIKIDNVRVNAQQSGGPFTTVSMFASGVTFGFFGDAGLNLVISGSSTTQVATVQTGFTFSKIPTAVPTLLQCNPAVAPTASTAANAPSLVFKPGFPGAFVGRVAAAGSALPAVANAGEVPEIAAENHGTFLKATFAVPAGATLWVGNRNTAAADNGNIAVRSTTQGATVPTVPDFAWVSIGGGAEATTQTVTWQVITVADLSQGTGSLTFPVYLQYNTTATGSLTAGGTLAPNDTTGTAAAAPVPVPRFVVSNNSMTLVNLANCTTTLLFPYVTNAAGWDTGIAISNTSGDIAVTSSRNLFGGATAAAGQTGACTIWYSGAGTTGTTAAVVATQVTPTVNAGATYAFTVSGVEAVPDAYSGFAIAQCNFQYAHGFAFMNGTASSGSAGVGYTALVMNSNRSDNQFPSRLGAVLGEVLGQ